MARIGPLSEPDRYELLELRSSGGEGQLWRGSLDVDGVQIVVAVKVIHASRNDNLTEWRTRWQRQAELLRSLDHPGLVKVRDIFEGPLPHAAGAADPTTNTLYLVMNWVEGPSLDEWVARNPNRDILDSAKVLGRLAAAVDYLHSGAVTGSPVLHRDIKPANVIVTDRGAVLVDFGFTRVLTDQPMSMVGTPAYIAREVLESNAHSAASDRYSLGATAYYAITGETPTPSDRPAMVRALTNSAGAEGREDIAEHVLSMMDPDPSRRPTGAVPWAQQLAAAAVSDTTLTVPRITPSTPSPVAPTPPVATRVVPAEPAPRKRRKGLLVAVGVVAVLAAIGGIAAFALSGGGGEGSDASDSTEASPAATIATKNEVAPETTAATAGTAIEATTTIITEVEVPSLSGKTLSEAQELLTEASLKFEIVEVEGPGPYSEVIETDPADGDAVAPGSTITLTFAKQPTILPDVIGQTSTKARKTLESYGITVTTSEFFAEAARDNTVTDQSPKPGEPFTTAVTLTVSRQPAISYLADLTRVDASYREFDTGQAQTNGTVYTRSVLLDPSGRDVSFVEYDVARKYTRLVGQVGLRDDASASAVYKIEVFADGSQIFDQTIGLGQIIPIDLDLTNVLRLRIQVTDLSPARAGSDYVVFADARILGVPGVVPTTTVG